MTKPFSTSVAEALSKAKAERRKWIDAALDKIDTSKPGNAEENALACLANAVPNERALRDIKKTEKSGSKKQVYTKLSSQYQMGDLSLRAKQNMDTIYILYQRLQTLMEREKSKSDPGRQNRILAMQHFVNTMINSFRKEDGHFDFNKIIDLEVVYKAARSNALLAGMPIEHFVDGTNLLSSGWRSKESEFQHMLSEIAEIQGQNFPELKTKILQAQQNPEHKKKPAP